MALDYSLAQKLKENDSPILRFYGWEPYSLSLGYHQGAELVNFDEIEANGYEVVRRPTGGSAIFHSEELTYALILPRKNVEHHDIYYLFHKLLAYALNSLGFNVELNYRGDKENYLKEGKKRFACFNRPAFAEIQYQNKKVVGSAQKLYRNAILQHGSILIGPKQNEIIRFLKLDEKAKQRYARNLKQKSISLQQINPIQITPIQIAEKLLEMFETTLNVNIFYQNLNEIDLNQAQKFVDYFKIK